MKEETLIFKIDVGRVDVKSTVFVCQNEARRD